MSKIIKLKEVLVAIAIVLLYNYIINKTSGYVTENMTSNELITHKFYRAVYMGYFFTSSGLVLLNLMYHFKISKISYDKIYSNSTFRFVLLLSFVIVSQVLFYNNLITNNYNNILPSYFLLIFTIFNMSTWNSVYVTKEYFITNNKKFYYKDIDSAKYTDSLKISIISKQKQSFLFCFTNKRYDFIRGLIQNNTA